MKPQNLKLKTLAGLITASMLSACGGGGGSSTAFSSVDTSNLTGTVPGTLIEAFCTDGSYYAVNSGTDNVSTDPNIPVAHPFDLPIPVGLTCMIVMTMNEDDPDLSLSTPIMFNYGTRTSPFFDVGTSNYDFGYVNLPADRTSVDEDDDGVSDNPIVLTASTVGVSTTVESASIDDDNDGVPNIYEDDDDDGLTNKYDDDDDGDGIRDEDDDDYEHDHDGDGVDDDHDSDEYNSGTSTTTTEVITAEPITFTANAGQLLLSQCAQCHGTNGRAFNGGFEGIYDEADEITLREMLGEAAIMDVHANAYTSAEFDLMRTYLLNYRINVNGSYTSVGGTGDYDDD